MLRVISRALVPLTGMIMCHIMLSRIFAFLVWALCAAGLAYWGLRWLSKPLPVPAHSATVSLTPTPKGDVARMLTAPQQSASDAAGPTAEQSAMASRMQLVGLMAAGGNGQGGVALMSVDGKPAKAYRVGQVVDGELVVLAITRQGVDIGVNGQAPSFTLPAQMLPPAATGTLPSALSADNAAVGMGNSPAGFGQSPYGQPPATAGQPSAGPSSVNRPRTALATPPGMQRDDTDSARAGQTPLAEKSGRLPDGTRFKVSPL